MNSSSDTILRISPERAEVFVEQEKDGVISRRSNSPGCFADTMTPKHTWYFIRYPELYADISYFGTEYPHFPLPRLVFGFQYLFREKKVVKSFLCVVKDERLYRKARRGCTPWRPISSGFPTTTTCIPPGITSWSWNTGTCWSS